MTISVGNPPSLLRFGCDEEWVKSRIHEFECELHLKVPDYSKVMIEIISAAPEQYRSGLGLAAGVATRPFLGARRFEKALQFIANAVAVLHGAVDPAEYDAAMKKLYGRGTYLKIVEGLASAVGAITQQKCISFSSSLVALDGENPRSHR